MNLKHIITMGTFRTGSTFLTRALSAHKNITVVSDPYFQFFKALRNEIFIREGCADFDKESPVSDNFYSEFIEVNSKIRNYSLKIPIQHNSLEEILDNIGRRAKRELPKIAPLLGDVKAKTYGELFVQLIKLLKRAYGEANTLYCGFKVNFAEQFLEVLLNTFPELRCIYLVRDPRAIVASHYTAYKNRKKGLNRANYPLLYIIRQWRKSFVYLLDNIAREKNVFLLRYEDMVAHPEKRFQQICAFLNLDYDSAMCDASRYKDEDGKQWRQNSSYGSSRTISKSFINKWKEVLTGEEIQLIEDLCFPEMELLGYQRTTMDNIRSSVLEAPGEDINKIDPWIRPYLNSYIFNETEIKKELSRRALLDARGESTQRESRLFETVFIGKDYLSRIKDVKQKTGSLVADE